MSTRISNRDRAVRSVLVAPAAIVAAVLVGAGSAAGIALLALAGIMLATSAVGFCPLYTLLRAARRPLAH